MKTVTELIPPRSAVIQMIASTLLFFQIDVCQSAEQREREVSFSSGNIKLAGTLLLPPNAGRVAAAILLHGSGPGPRSETRYLAEQLLHTGIAALIFDKRGSGSSEGDWMSASLDDLAEDALAGTAFLKKQLEVDSARVGLCGISQGGWVISRAAALQPDGFAFALAVTGGGLLPRDVERYDYASALDEIGATSTQKAEALALVDRYLSYLQSGSDRAGLMEAIKSARAQPWFRALNIDRVVPNEAQREKWAWVADYAPAADIEKMRMPVLVMLAGQDRRSLALEMNQRWSRSLAANPDATIVDILNAAHGMTVAGRHHTGADAQSYVPGYLEMVAAWLRTHSFTD